MSKRLLNLIPLVVPAGLVLFLDQITKAWVRGRLRPGQVLRPELSISRIIRITHARNFGAAGGIFQGWSDVFLIISLAISLGVLFYYPRTRPDERLLRWSLGLLLGGGLGNLVDRLLQGYVLDFVSIGVLPVFNIADLAILLGAVGLALGLWQREAAQQARKTTSTPKGN